MSSNQKHTVSTDALDTLGTCPIPDNSGRDAIHLAVEPVECGWMALKAGDRVKIEGGKAVPAKTFNSGSDATGIVDPFVNRTIRPGEKFWFVVLPRTITSLRHVWSHPAFPEAAVYHEDKDDDHYGFIPEQSMAQARMKEWCVGIGERYDYIMKGAKKYLETGDYTYGERDSGNLEGVDLPTWFWDTYETITGEKVRGDARSDGSFFSCSC